MADMLSILIIMIVVYICGKKLIIPRIVALRAAKKGQTALTAPCTATAGGGMPFVQTAVQAGGRPVTCFDMRLVNTAVSDEEDADTVLTRRITYAASEMLLNASLRGSDVRLYIVNAFHNALMLYVTYAVR